jgi:hypothetical protein
MLYIYYTLTAYNKFIGTSFHKACYSVAAAVIIGVPENSAFSLGGGTQFVFTIRRISGRPQWLAAVAAVDGRPSNRPADWPVPVGFDYVANKMNPAGRWARRDLSPTRVGGSWP